MKKQDKVGVLMKVSEYKDWNKRGPPALDLDNE